jgi:hypothetical protein
MTMVFDILEEKRKILMDLKEKYELQISMQLVVPVKESR